MNTTILAIVVLTLLLLSSSAVHVATAASFTAIKSGAWSDPSTWGLSRGGDDYARAPRLPSPGDHVVIAANTHVVFGDGGGGGGGGTTSTSLAVRVTSVNIQRGAVLSCPPSSAPAPKPLILELALLRIEGGGCFSCGYGDCTKDAEPYAGTFTLRLRSVIPPQTADENIRSLVVEDGGALYLSGAPRGGRAVVRLDADADVGATRLVISGADGVGIADAATNGGGQQQQPQQPWKVGDRVAIAPTDFDPTQTEYHTIVGIYPSTAAKPAATSSYTIEIADALRYARSGRVFQFTNRADNNRVVTLDARAEIALLSRNVVIEGTDDAVNGLGGDLMMVGSNVRARLSWVEIRRMGRRGHPGRYPLHIHNLGDGGRNVFVSNVAIHSSYQRGVVVHCTDGVTLVNNTVAGTFGFGYMLEDGAEEGNQLIGNYAIDIRPAGTKLLTKPLIQTERVNPAGFWFVNAANTWRNNVAAGVAGAGFSLDMDAALADRPATLTTCPEALPRWSGSSKWKGANGPQDQDTATVTKGFNTAVYTALMRKRFVKFEDNVAHAAFSGLWMTYPFIDIDDLMATTPMQGAAQTDIERLTAWKIGFRPFAMEDLTDGVTLIFEACVHMRNPRRMRVHRMTCLNAQRVAWSSLSASFDGTTFGWLSDQELKSSGVSGKNRPAVPTTAGAFLSYLEPHTFARTHVVGGSNFVAFATAFQGQRMAPFNVLHGLSLAGPQPRKNASAAAAAAAVPLILLNAGDCHVYTDETGDAFGAGPGAMVVASCPGCLGVDPLVEAHAPGKCAAAVTGAPTTTSSTASSTSEARGLLPNGAVVAAKGGAVPMLCYGGGGGGGDVRFVVLDLVFVRDGNPLRSIQMEALGPVWSIRTSLRTIKAFPILLPLTPDSMDGGYRIDIGTGNFEYFDVSFGPTTRPDDEMTILITGRDVADFTATPGPATTASDMSPKDGIVKEGSAACVTHFPKNIRPVYSCPSDPILERAPPLPRVCICRVAGSQQLVLRFRAGSQRQYRGLYAADGSERPTYSLGTARVSRK